MPCKYTLEPTDNMFAWDSTQFHKLWKLWTLIHTQWKLCIIEVNKQQINTSLSMLSWALDEWIWDYCPLSHIFLYLCGHTWPVQYITGSLLALCHSSVQPLLTITPAAVCAAFSLSSVTPTITPPCLLNYCHLFTSTNHLPSSSNQWMCGWTPATHPLPDCQVSSIDFFLISQYWPASSPTCLVSPLLVILPALHPCPNRPLLWLWKSCFLAGVLRASDGWSRVL